MLDALANQAGLLGISGVSGDIRDLQAAAADGHSGARLALDVYIADIRRHLGGLLVLLGGADSIVFTGGIGENSADIRSAVCWNLTDFGIELDESRNTAASGELPLQSATSRVSIWILPTNEELVVARQTAALLKG
jgi:acetate kinase